MLNAIEQFRNAIHSAGLIPPDSFEPGKLHRIPGDGKSPRNRAGWCKLFPDGEGGVYGDWSTGLSEAWQAKRDRPFSEAERAAFRQRCEQERREREAEEAKQRETAKAKAAVILQVAQPATADHPYLVHKCVQPHGVRQHEGRLVIPMRADGKLQSLQFIADDGSKLFLSGGRVRGCYFSIGNTKGAAALCIVEGFATGASVNQATGHPVAVAFNAGNLEPVALAMRAKFPELRLILCADDDAATSGNPGLTKATEAACAVGGFLAVPNFGMAAT